MSGFIEKISPEIKKQDTIEDKKDEKKGKMSECLEKNPQKSRYLRGLKKR